MTAIAEFAGLEYAGLENDGLKMTDWKNSTPPPRFLMVRHFPVLQIPVTPLSESRLLAASALNN